MGNLRKNLQASDRQTERHAARACERERERERERDVCARDDSAVLGTAASTHGVTETGFELNTTCVSSATKR